MAHRKAGGSAKNLRDSQPKYLGTKLYDGQTAKAGSIIVRQRGSRILAGENVRMGKDHTLYATEAGTVKFTQTRKKRFNNTVQVKKVANVVVEDTQEKAKTATKKPSTKIVAKPKNTKKAPVRKETKKKAA